MAPDPSPVPPTRPATDLRPRRRPGRSPRSPACEESLEAPATLLAERHGDPVQVVAVSSPDDPDAATNGSDGLPPSPHAKLAGPTFGQWLAGR